MDVNRRPYETSIVKQNTGDWALNYIDNRGGVRSLNILICQRSLALSSNSLTIGMIRGYNPESDSAIQRDDYADIPVRTCSRSSSGQPF